GDLHVLAVRGDALRSGVDCLKARAAVPIDRDAADLERQTRDQRRHAGNVVALFALLLHAAPMDVLDLGRRYADALQEPLHQVSRQIVGPDVAVHSLLGMGPTDRRADGVDYYSVAHVRLLAWRSIGMVARVAESLKPPGSDNPKLAFARSRARGRLGVEEER